ncbi:MAG: hypothetical protein AMJ90_00105 [candidate division Zixibacteria bacterium SM23_73_2]|nr:MAG: hypothetical protein AMJ90_00105 [candidate division Zixibacteria bacterium SM23_73_2]
MPPKKDFAKALHQKIKRFLIENSDPKIIKKYARYFKEGYDAYGIDPKSFHKKRDGWFELCQKNLSTKEIIAFCEELVKSKKYEEKSIAIDFIIRLKEDYNKALFNKMGKWFEKYVDNWAHSDWACSDVLYHFIAKKIITSKELLQWTKSPSRWKRRAAAVTMVKLVSKHGKIKESLSVAKKLILDPERVVHQGVGWLLRETWKKAPKEIEDFLYQWKEKAPRLIIQYATEKIPKEKRKRFRRSK